ncbi:Group II intron-encoded protein LtrA [Rubripirellula obstinata]|uniref:Group II intron-encoded protein LtrA n=1 Tax=Rubripirellula obstinata TaxID=406547 RepID=A0A5B1CJ30_9BACT|nr:group II intron reverse transcriptase/maturase [Rubripirellula obstinata]KAA1259453.1 Group II intron-encoded protein LtrA [Rubripirellula obstinata]KAA1259795.1 Group II intron-encoded protein LtrA [Rubripirellula obstinata]KAA1259932.1 Group II intron-encoded protein LtrA [Rubripirellula obstinata]KAA1260750.1 Group II intron-encoded protein LtrA [Rubripirellula obstinata]
MGKKRKVHSLTGRIDDRLLMQSFKAVKRNRGAAGIDKVSVGMFEENLDANLAALKRDLKTRDTFVAKPLRRVFIPKDAKGKSFRPLGIPAVRDRVAQEVIRRLLEPIFEPLFHDCSFGFRPKRSCHKAIEKLLEFHEEGDRVTLDADIAGFFDNIPHKLIVDAVAEEVADGNILNLIWKFLAAGVMENGVFKPTTIGTPQGGVISPLLANIVLNKLDWRLEQAGYRFVRYADDFVVVCKDRVQAKAALELVTEVMTELGLSLSPEKTKIASYGKGYDFLGFRLSSKSRTMRTKSEEKFKTKIREITRRCHNLDAEVIKKLNQVIRGTANFFATKFSTCIKLFQKLDRWIRMRVRSMKFKRKWSNDNYRLRKRNLQNKLGLLGLLDFTQTTMSKTSR